MIRSLTVALCLCVSGSAWAQDNTAGPTDEDKAQAKRLVGEAQTAFNNGAYKVCAQKFSTAFKLAPLPQIQFNLALCYAGQERYRDAALEYEAAGDHPDMPAEMRAKAKESLAKMRGFMAKIRIEGASGGGLIDGSIACKLPCTLYLEPGDHVVTFGLDGERKSFTATKGHEAIVSLKKEAATEDKGKPKPTEADFDATAPDSNARPDLTNTGVTASTKSESSGPSYLTWGGGGLAVAGTAGALVFGLKTRGLHDDFTMMPTQALADDGEQMRTFTNVSIGVAIVGASLVVYDLLSD